jgi:hypothetical protein
VEEIAKRLIHKGELQAITNPEYEITTNFGIDHLIAWLKEKLSDAGIKF